MNCPNLSSIYNTHRLWGSDLDNMLSELFKLFYLMRLYDYSILGNYTIHSHGHQLEKRLRYTIRKIQCLDVKRRSERDIQCLYYGITSWRYILSLYRIKCI